MITTRPQCGQQAIILGKAKLAYTQPQVSSSCQTSPFCQVSSSSQSASSVFIVLKLTYPSTTYVPADSPKPRGPISQRILCQPHLERLGQKVHLFTPFINGTRRRRLCLMISNTSREDRNLSVSEELIIITQHKRRNNLITLCQLRPALRLLYYSSLNPLREIILKNLTDGDLSQYVLVSQDLSYIRIAFSPICQPLGDYNVR